MAITLGRLNPGVWRDAACLADELGFGAVLLSDHLVAPAGQAEGLGGESWRMKPDTPLYDAVGYCHYLAGLTRHVRLGTYVFLLGLRHPFASARALATLDQVSDGRALLGVGAGWLTAEWDAAGISAVDRGARLDEAIEVCRRLWREETVRHEGRFWRFPAVGFEPKPVQLGGPPVLVGGESSAALLRAARLGDGWMGRGGHTPASAAGRIETLRLMRATAGRSEEPFHITVGGEVSTEDHLAAWGAAGVDRVVVAPWRSSRTALADLKDFAATIQLTPPDQD
ncbi:TIGR03619 family F420-dependent LLM class oxidoreductase [Amycolatopsis bartoniae]|nr:TIGR03619 family F420-dependent LLM class oxidoreductase [Amycolatopsis bartoniae]